MHEPDRDSVDPASSGLPSRSLVSGFVSVLLFAALTVSFRTVGLSPPPITPVVIFVCALCALWFVDGRTLRRIPVPVSLVTLWFWIALSIVWSENTFETTHAVGRDVSLMVALALLIGVTRLDTCFATMLWAIRFAVVVTVVAVAVRPESRVWVDPSGTAPDLAGWLGLFPHKNHLGPFLAFAAVTVWSFDTQRWTRYATLGAIAVLLVGSRSVTGMIGTAVALTIWSWLHLDARIAAGRRTILRRLTSVAVVIGVAVATIAPVALAGLVGKNSTFSGRTEIWGATFDAWTDRPLFGFGFEGVLQPHPLTEQTAAIWREIGFAVVHAHNGLLGVGLQLGLVGVVIVCSVIVSTLIDAVRVRPDDPTLAAWVIALVVAQLVMSVSEDMYLGNSWVGALVICKVVLLRRRRELSDTAAMTSAGGGP